MDMDCLINGRRTYKMAIASLDSVIRRSWSPETSVWRLIAAVLLVMRGTSGVALAQVSENYIVQFREGTSAEARAAVVRGAGAALGVNFGRVNAAAVRVPNANALTALVNNPFVRAVVPNRPVFAYQNGKGKPGGGGGGTTQVVPAGVARVGRPTGSSNGLGVGVAVIDTGVDLGHPDLAGTVDAFNAFGAQSCQDDEGHGTHVAGIIAARDNTADVVGVAPQATIYCVKVLDSAGSGSDANVMSGLEWVLENYALDVPIKVVNMSLGRPGAVDDNPAMHDLIIALEGAGLTVVVAAGNDPTVDVSSQIPAAYPEVIAVASTTALAGTNQCRFLSTPVAADTASYFTTDGTGVIVSAPGEDQENVSRGCFISSVGILSTRLGGGTMRMSGTSMASPHVAGVAARYYQAGFQASDIRQFLQLDADHVGTAPLDSPSSQYTFDGAREGIVQAP
jgi:subtilisin